jgi:hypothetical protein
MSERWKEREEVMRMVVSERGKREAMVSERETGCRGEGGDAMLHAHTQRHMRRIDAILKLASPQHTIKDPRISRNFFTPPPLYAHACESQRLIFYSPRPTKRCSTFAVLLKMTPSKCAQIRDKPHGIFAQAD